MKAAVVGLLIVVCALAWFLISEITRNNQLHSQIADKSRLESLQLQEKCAEQAKKVFHELGYKDSQQNGNVDSYQSHYNIKLGKCFLAIESMNITTTPGTQFINRVLLDAFEKREYAEYTWMSDKDRKYWEVPPKVCKLIPSSKNEQICKSDDEYKTFVASYME